MASILKVDTLQKPDGSTPTAADLGLDVAGSVVQVATDQVSGAHIVSSSASYTSTGLSVAITPKYSNSKFIVSCQGGRPYLTSGLQLDIKLMHNGTLLPRWEAMYSTDNVHQGGHSMAYVTIPNSSAEQTFEVYFAANAAGSNVYFSHAPATGEYPVTLTVYEIAQ